MLNTIQSWFEAASLSPAVSLWIARGLLILVVIALCFLTDWLARKIIAGGFAKLAAKTRTKLDDAIIEAKVFNRLARIAPALVLYSASGVLFPEENSSAAEFVGRVANAYMYLVGALCLSSVLDAVINVYQTIGNQSGTAGAPIRGFVRIIKSVAWIVGLILILSELMDKDPWNFIASLGAMTAIVMLVFKDSILGFVASIQIATKDLVRIGDWIEFPKFRADGDVIDITLNTVKVQNWDKTISSIPTYALISDSFKNWRGMSNSQGRRIKRALHIDVSSIKFCDDEMLERLKKVEFIKEYLADREQEVQDFNETHEVDTSVSVNGRRLTNIGTFRHYVEAYIRNHASIHKGMTLLVRQLAADEFGVPIEIYCFSSDKVWANYESIQADIFDHLLAVVPYFDLRVFQSPSGEDVKLLASDESARA